MATTNKIPEIEKELIKSPNLFPVVGIGASAGGLDAFKKLLKAVPEDSGMAYVLVQHLDPSHESLLVELLQKVTKIPVLEIADDIKVEPNHIYILPSNKMMIANDGVLELSPRPAKNKKERNLPIDLFFTSLAEVHQSHAIGVVLSGTASDGTMGLKAIKDNGGITFAQDEESAAYEGMPHSAVEAGVVDFILSPDKIPEKLLEVINIIKGNDEEDIPQQAEEVFKHILSLLRIRKGTDFTYYKQSTIRRRILRRMAINKTEEPSAYLNYLREKKTEQDLLYQDLLIPVTDFFRDPKIFDTLCKSVFPDIVQNKKEGEPIRVWIAGCSTGEEVYSIAICFKELLDEIFSPDGNQRVQIFATDISEPAIAKARSGIYSSSDVKGLSEEHLTKYFTKNNGDYQAKKSIRDLCVFAVHNFLKDPAFSKMDLISCRNVLIYMEPYLQKKALTTFHYALNSKGLLLLGKSETTSGVPDHFAICQWNGTSKTDKIFTCKDIPGRFVPTASLLSEKSFTDKNVNSKSEIIQTDFQKTADDIMLSKYTPAGVVVNELMDIVHFRGKTGNFLEPSPGKASLNLLKMAKEELAFELRNILHRAKKENTTVTKENIPVQVNGVQQNISIEAIPLPNIIEPHYLVLFHNHVLNTNHQIPTGTKKSFVASKSTNEAKDLRIEQLEKELAQSREDMRSITEEQEAANEELQSANEELLSSSEELQSLNEEMETSKEELQSTNEELTVVNQEMIGLNEQVTEARDYAEAIISSLHEPLLVLDKHLRIKSANTSFYKTFHVNEKDTEGKLLFDLGNKQWEIPALRKQLQNILSHSVKFENFEVAHNFPNIGERIVVLNGREVLNDASSENLILLAIEDITEQVNAHKKIEESEFRYHNMISTSTSAIGILQGKDMLITTANNAIIEIWGKGNDVIGKSYFELLPELAEQGYKEIFDAVYTTGKPFAAVESPVHVLQHGKITLKYYNFILQPQHNAEGEIIGVGIIATEVTTQAEHNVQLRESEERFRLLADNIPLNVFIIEPSAEAKISYWNKYWLDYTGQTMEEALGKTWDGVIHPDDMQPIMDVYKPAFEDRKPYYLPGIRIKRYDGQYRWFAIQANPRYLPNGEFIGYIGVGFDIHEQKLFEKELIEAKVMAENAAKFKQQFLSNMSHEIRTPLNSILGFANVLMKTELGEKQKEYVQAVKTSGHYLNLLINDILDLAKVDAGKMTFEKQPFEIQKSIKSVVHSFDLKIKEKNLAFSSEYDSEIPSILIGDAVRLNQIVLNLMSNAIKFTHKGGIILSVKIQSEDAENLLLKFTVTDSGIGISEDKINSVFNLFEQAEISTSNSYGGTGLGLSIVKQFVEFQGGNVSVTSKLGKGSVFSFSLPFEKTKIKTIEEVETLQLDPKIKTLRVLVAEDIPLNQLLIKILLSDFGFEYDVVENGKIVIEKLQANAYDIILMDLQMPELNGFETTEYIRNTMKSNIPIIALTADVTTVDVAKCKAFGMDDYISKPINENQLYTKIVALIKK